MSGKLKATEEQIAYAKFLDIGMKMGLVMLVISFFIYIFGIFTPHVPVNNLPKYWSMPVKEYLIATNIHTGWSWVHMIGKGDFLNFVGIAFLSGVTILCYMVILPILIKKKDKAYAIFAVIEILVLALAASGVLRSGGH